MQPYQPWQKVLSILMSASFFLGLLQSGPAAAAPEPQLVPAVGQSLKNDVSPALSDLAQAVAPLLPAGPVQSLPLVTLPKVKSAASSGADQALQAGASITNSMPDPVANFEGVNNINGVHPPDTQGDIGYDPATGKKYYVQWVNLAYQIWDVTDPASPVSKLPSPANGNTLWNGFGGACETSNDGDPITLFDPMAGRWMMSQFALPNYPNGPFYQCTAISTSGNPAGTWYRYMFMVHATKMNDYPKLGVWPDAYYMTDNQFTSGWAGAGVFAFDRARMLAGLPATFIYFDLASVNINLGGMLPADLDGNNLPPAGTPGIFIEVDDSANLGDPTDTLRLWYFHADFTTPANSTFGTTTGGDANLANFILPVANFDYLPCVISGMPNCIPQQGTSQRLDSLGDRMMYRLVYRNFGAYQSLYASHTVKADGVDRAGVRWYELRDSGSGWAINQQSTYAPADGLYRWMSSIAADKDGNIAMGYSVSSSGMYPAIRYAGRLAADPANTLAQGETTLFAGTGAQLSTYARWGDYSMLGVDPQDDCTFWYTNEYIGVTSNASWRTRIGSFKFPSCVGGTMGTLAGTITHGGSGQALSGATISAGAYSTTSGADGTYSMTLPVGTYTVTAAAYGFASQSATGIAITSDGNTQQDFALDPQAEAILQGAVTDGSGHSFPLYARIEINAPGYAITIYSDPFDGSYSASLFSGVSYQLTVTPVQSGYVTQSVPVTLTTNPFIRNFSLLVDPLACSVPGYQRVETVINTESFDAVDLPALPTGWATLKTAGAGNPLWQTNAGTNNPGGIPAHSGANLVYFNSYDVYPYNVARLYQTTSVSLAGYTGATLSFWMVHDPGYPQYNDTLQPQISTDGGATWANLGPAISRLGTGGWTRHLLDLGAYVGPGTPGVRLGFLGTSAFGNDIHLDDIQIISTACNQVEGGLVAGYVTDANSGAGLNGMPVKNDAVPALTAATFSTPTDLTAGDGLYFLFQATAANSENHTLTASGPAGYAPDGRTVLVTRNATTRQDFSLTAGVIGASPMALEASLYVGETTTLPLALGNSGTLAVNYQLKELDRGVLPVLGPFETPNYVVKPFKQNFPSAEKLGFPPERSYQPYAAGEIISSWGSGLGKAWGLAVDLANDHIWVSSPAAAWGGTNSLSEYTPGGTPTGRSLPYSWSPASGPADLAYNIHTGKLWVVNVSPDNCIYEINPDSGYTGRQICPGGGAGFAVAQRGLAYDPATDTFYSGGWNDQIVNQFNANGEILRSINVGLSIAGLAYNPDSQHLFIIINSSQTAIYVLDAANNLASLGSFGVTGMGAYAGAGLEMGCNGSLWVADENDGMVYNLQSGETTTFCNMDVPWLEVAPASGSILQGESQPVQVTFSATDLSQPGIYQAQLKLVHDTPYSVPGIPVTLHVYLPASWGSLNGTVTGLGLCDAAPAQPLANATVEIWNTALPPVLLKTLTTVGTGQYTWPVPAGTYTIRAYTADYVSQSQLAILAAGQTLSTNLSLRRDAPCLSAAPASLSASLHTDQTEVQQLVLDNTGAAAGDFTITEQNGSPLLGVRLANPQGLLIQEAFESRDFPPQGWTRPEGDGAYSWKSAANPHSGLQGAVVRYDPALQAQDEWLLTPTLDLARGVLSFWSSGSVYWCQRSYDNCDLKIWIVVGEIGGGDDLLVGKADDSWTADWVWAQSIFDLNRFLPGGAVQIGFEYTGSNGAQVSLDDIQLDGIQLTDVPWVSVAPLAGSIPAGASQPIVVTFDAAGLPAGDYHASLNLSGQGTGEINIPLTLVITAEHPLVWLPLVRR